MSVTRHSRRRLTAAAATAVAALTLGSVSALPAQAAEPGPAKSGTIEGADAPGAVENSYIVTLDESAEAAGKSGKSVAAKYGAKIKRTYQSALNGYSVRLSEAKARKLAGDPAVESVVQNRVVKATDTQTNPTWGLDRIDQRELPLDQSYTYPSHAGQGVTAYVIDTGVRISHEEFGGRASYGYDAVDNDNTAQDGNGHGTHVAGTIAGSTYGVAKQAEIVGVRVLNDSGSGTTAGVIAGIDWVTQNAQKPAVANMSLGGGASSALDDAVRNSIASGVTYAVAAGNANSDASNSSPARVSEALTIGATTSSDSRASFSNYGSVLDLFAPGQSITSAWNSGDSATNTISGTSMATPHVAGGAALYLADNRSASPDQVASALTTAATGGVVTNPGPSSPNKLLYVGDGSTQPPSGPSFENTDDYPIRDHSTTESPVSASGLSSTDSPKSVSVDIKHTWIGDLKIELVAPDGTATRLKNHGTGGSQENLNTTYNVSTSAAGDGTWKLRVTDNASWDQGVIDSWSVQF